MSCDSSMSVCSVNHCTYTPTRRTLSCFKELNVAPFLRRQKDKKSRLSLFLTKSGSHENVSPHTKTNTTPSKWGKIHSFHMPAMLCWQVLITLTSVLTCLYLHPLWLLHTGKKDGIQTSYNTGLFRDELTASLICFVAASHQKPLCSGATPSKNCCHTQVRLKSDVSQTCSPEKFPPQATASF